MMSRRSVFVIWATAILLTVGSQGLATEPTVGGELSSKLRYPSRILESESLWTLTSMTWEETVSQENGEQKKEEEEAEPAKLPSSSPSDTLPSPEIPVQDTAPSKPRPACPCKTPVPSPHKTLYYDNDFNYLLDPCNRHCYLGDSLKRREVGCMILDVGGEYRLRHHNEHILARHSDFLLQRTRLYANLEVRPWLRFYGEAIDATSAWEDVGYPPSPIEENRFDALNLFGDVRIFDSCRRDIWLRGGRQELLYGSQRLVSPLDWSNTRRTFDGFKLFHQGPKWNIDAFWTRPVGLGQHVPNDHNFDNPDVSQDFIGVWFTRKGMKNHKLDFYYLRLAEWDAPAAAPVDTFNFDTFGARWEGKHGNWLWEVEGGYQAGTFGPERHSAGFYTLGGGRKFPCLPWSPALWVYYDWASGDRDPADGVDNTFRQLFPLGHKYLGFMDFVGRQNIEDWNARLTVSPHKKVDLVFWYHVFNLQQPTDALYNAGGIPIRHDPTGAAGRDVGQELDFLVKFKLRPRSDLICGYSHLWAGDFLRATTPAGTRLGEDFYYTQFTVRF